MPPRLPTIAGLLKRWLAYVGMGMVFAAIFYVSVGDKPRPEPALAVFAIFVAIGTIIVGTAAWGLVRTRKSERDGF
jgi:hypothetical protein